MSQVYSDGVITHTQSHMMAISFCHGVSLKEVEKRVILETLKVQRFNRTKTAKVLGIGIRTLQRKLKQYSEAGEEDLALMMKLQ